MIRSLFVAFVACVAFSHSATAQIFGRPAAYPTTADEVTAGVTPRNLNYASLPRIDLRRYGLAEAATGAVNRGAIESGILLANTLGGAILDAPPGDYTIDATVAFNVDRVILNCNKTIWHFDPAAPDVLFDFDRGASSVLESGVIGCRFFSANSIAKTAIRVDDARTFTLENVVIAQGAWAGSASIGFDVHGRELVWLNRSTIITARPVVVGVNPNFATIHTDFFVFEDSILGSTETSGSAIEVATGVNLSNLTVNRIAFVLGGYGFRWNDTTSTIASYATTFRDCRSEQATDAAGYTIEMTSTAQRNQQVTIEGCKFDPNRNGLRLTQADAVILRNSQFDGAGGRTDLNIIFGSTTELRLEGTFVQVGSTNTLTNSLMVTASPFNAVANALPQHSLYRYDEAAVTSQRPSFTMGGARNWTYQGTLASGATLTTPITRALYSAAMVQVAAYASVGPIHSTCVVGWTTNGVTTKVGGSANCVAAAVGVEIRVLDSGAGLVIVNNIGQNVVIVINVTMI